jgi:hypothetical protein
MLREARRHLGTEPEMPCLGLDEEKEVLEQVPAKPRARRTSPTIITMA